MTDVDCRISKLATLGELMDETLKTLVQLLDQAIGLAQDEKKKASTGPEGIRAMADLTLDNIVALRLAASQGALPRPSKGANLGLSRNIGEWLEESPLLDMAYKIDNFYSTEMNTSPSNHFVPKPE